MITQFATQNTAPAVMHITMQGTPFSKLRIAGGQAPDIINYTGLTKIFNQFNNRFAAQKGSLYFSSQKCLPTASSHLNNNSIMANSSLHLPTNKGVSQTILLNPQSEVLDLYPPLGASTLIQANNLKLDCNPKVVTINSSPDHSGNLINFSLSCEKIETGNVINLILEDREDTIKIQANKLETVRNFKQRIGRILKCDSVHLDVMIRGNLLSDQNQILADNLLQSQFLVRVKPKISPNSFITNLVSRVKDVESFGSSQGQFEQSQLDCSSALKKENLNAQKKSSFSASLRDIKQNELGGKQKLKFSSIQPYTMHKNQRIEIEQKSNKLLKMLDIKQTMSFGSLQETKFQESYIDVRNEQGTMQWGLWCPFGCQILDVRQKLAKAQRLAIAKLSIVEADDDVIIEDLEQEDRIRLTLRIKK